MAPFPEDVPAVDSPYEVGGIASSSSDRLMTALDREMITNASRSGTYTLRTGRSVGKSTSMVSTSMVAAAALMLGVSLPAFGGDGYSRRKLRSGKVAGAAPVSPITRLRSEDRNRPCPVAAGRRPSGAAVRKVTQ